MERKRRAAVVIAVVLALAPAPSEAAPTISGGDCWRSLTPLWCRGTWRAGEFLRIYAIDRFSDARPAWRSAFLASNSAWSGANGPQLFSVERRTNDTWVFYEDSTTGRDGLSSSQLALTWHCHYSTYCSPSNEAMNVRFSSIKLNVRKIPNDSGTKTAFTFAHESGHALGLAHHSSPTDLMYLAYNGVTSPSPSNSGTLPPCTGSTSTSNAKNNHAGVRCVYNWRS